jgi:acetyl esterase/lipase
MKFASFSALSRLVLAFVLLVGLVAPAAAQVTIFSPFNLKEAMDSGVTKQADIPYADGQRKKLDIYQPDEMTGPAPVVMFIYGGAWRAGDRFEYERPGHEVDRGQHRQLWRRQHALLPRRPFSRRLQRGDAVAR